MRYEYYIHYMGLDRRLERWVTEHYLRVDDQNEIERQKKIVEEAEAKKKQDTYLYNDENLGWDEKYVQEFFNATKHKTVESLQFGKYWLESWYFSPLPKEYHCKCLYVCDFCLAFFTKKREFL